MGLLAATLLAGLTTGVSLFQVAPYGPEPILHRADFATHKQLTDVSLIGARGETLASSIVVDSTKPMKDMMVSISDLRNEKSGKTIDRSAFDIRVVKRWYRARYSWNKIVRNEERELLPNLLIHNDDLIYVDQISQKNYVLLGHKKQKYHALDDISESLKETKWGYHPEIWDFYIKDSKTLQPFDVGPNQFQQLWINADIPNDTPSGIYSGKYLFEQWGLNWFCRSR